ncbi:hypothetical protein HFN06_28470 [Rhizobium leguminosarum]|uniref:Uncharacterized protein n=1 Tax=Rhizobium johnstonii (strain DSM 114642 / LMG 32736 / 3841) TaxID=216596 RepID=Q1M976_RHIJ3|nr:hypothetical protein [Rhizobium leguminosarum]CAK03857.1 hypothetical protein pRL90141 [Rhizobium johnstonii 3841]
MHALKTLEKPDGRGWIAPAKCGIDIFFPNSAILGNIALRLVLIEMVMGGRPYRFDQPVDQHFKRNRFPAEIIGHAV